MSEDLRHESVAGFPRRQVFIVGLGASAGGLEPLEKFFDKMPTDSGLAFVVVQHLSPDFKSLMDQLLARHTKIRIVQAENGLLIEPNTIYLLPPKNNLSIEGGRLNLSPLSVGGGINLPIDVFFSSLARETGQYGIGVILSGTGSDGSRGIQDIRNANGLTLAQDASSASFDGMPLAATKTGAVDIVCPPETMAPIIMKYVADPTNFNRQAYQRLYSPTQNEDINAIFATFRQKYGVDFSLYKPATIQRRIERRLEFSRSQSIGEYLRFLNDDPSELDSLYRDLLVEVTHFFRDQEAFVRLKDDVIPKLVREANDGRELRIWTAGCATGEEAYSLAMLFADAARERNLDIPFKVFASDLHQASMEIASRASYPVKALEKVPEQFMDFFQAHGETANIAPAIRRRVVFARHDITRDPPFTRIDLLSCRNVLIYLEPEIQQKALAAFHFGLRVSGYLFLGPSESTGQLSKEFEVIDQPWRIYRKQRDVRLSDATRLSLGPMVSTIIRDRPDFLPKAPSNDEAWFLSGTYEEMLARYMPPSLLVNEFYELLHTFGEATSFISQPVGRTTLDVTKMLQGELRTAIIAALHRAESERSQVRFRGIKVDEGETQRTVSVSVEPYNKGKRNMYLICLEPEDDNNDIKSKTEQPVGTPFSEENQGRLDELEQELDHTRQSLQTTVEELETSNEELQSTNEELIASNEELQSTNEELHSVNEELYTVNAEYQRKITELTDTTNDLNNLLESTEIGTIFLDEDFRIRKFTPAITNAFYMLDSDIGRPIEHIAYNLVGSDLMADLESVRQTGKPIELEVKGRDGQVYLKRIRPYKGDEATSTGMVLTFDNITAIKTETNKKIHAEKQLVISQNELQEFAYAVSHDLQSPLRHLGDFVSLAQEEGPASVDENLGKMRDSIQRMESMIRALLEYSRVHTLGEEKVRTDLSLPFENAAENLRPLIKEKKAEIQFEQLPNFECDSKQMTQVFFHLLQNALLYNTSTRPDIHVGVEHRDKSWVIGVHDNGIGIERRHYDRIFVIFQRLGFLPEVPGIGLGLALTRRILERHDCWIWAESTPGQGSSFFIQHSLVENGSHKT